MDGGQAGREVEGGGGKWREADRQAGAGAGRRECGRDDSKLVWSGGTSDLISLTF